MGIALHIAMRIKCGDTCKVLQGQHIAGPQLMQEAMMTIGGHRS